MSHRDSDSDTPAYSAYINGTYEEARKKLEALVAAGDPEARIWLEELGEAHEHVVVWE
jgi:hypothetical protein